MTTQETVSSKILSLLRTISAKIEEGKRNGKIKLTENWYIRKIIKDWNYHNNSGSHRTSYEKINKNEWHWYDQFVFIKVEVEFLSEYEDALIEIAKKYNATKEQANEWLSRLVQVLIHHDIEKMPADILVENVNTFLADLGKEPVKWDLKIWINGISLEDSNYEILEGLRLRNPIPLDLEAEYSTEMFPIMPIDDPKELKDAILEFSCKATEAQSVYDEIDVILNCLRLYRLGAITAEKIEMKPRSILLGNNTSHSGNGRFSNWHKYRLIKSDLDKIRPFVSTIQPLLSELNAQFSTGVENPLLISLRRYNDALLRPECVEERITFAIVCLESLFLTANEQDELAHRLGQRVAVLLRIFDFEANETYKKVKRAYGIRSKYIHGSTVGQEKLKEARGLMEQTLEYARVSLLVFLQLTKRLSGDQNSGKKALQKRKEELIERIDVSLLDNTAFSELKKWVVDNCIISK